MIKVKHIWWALWFFLGIAAGLFVWQAVYPAHAYAAVSVGADQHFFMAQGGSSDSQTMNLGASGSNAFLVCNVGYFDTGDHSTAMTWNGAALTNATSTFSGTNPASKNDVWYLKNPASGSHTLTINFSGAIGDGYYGASYGCIDFFGVDQTTPLQSVLSKSDEFSYPYQAWTFASSTVDGSAIFTSMTIIGSNTLTATSTGTTEIYQYDDFNVGHTITAASYKLLPTASSSFATGWVLATGNSWTINALIVRPDTAALVGDQVHILVASSTPFSTSPFSLFAEYQNSLGNWTSFVWDFFNTTTGETFIRTSPIGGFVIPDDGFASFSEIFYGFPNGEYTVTGQACIGGTGICTALSHEGFTLAVGGSATSTPTSTISIQNPNSFYSANIPALFCQTATCTPSFLYKSIVGLFGVIIVPLGSIFGTLNPYFDIDAANNAAASTTAAIAEARAYAGSLNGVFSVFPIVMILSLFLLVNIVVLAFKAGWLVIKLFIP